jgi:F0F1-type ATP synthase assembly protein I
MLPKPRPSRETVGTMNAYGRYATLGIQFVASMCILGFVGYWADGKLGTYPWLLIVGLFLGAAGSFYSLLQAIPPSSTSARSKGTSDSVPDDSSR